MIKAVIFDMDGVIIDSEMGYTRLVYELGKVKNPDLTIEQLYPIVGTSEQATWEIVAEVIGNGQTWQEIRQEYRDMDVYSKIDFRALFRPEVRNVLQFLTDHGFQKALASSTARPIVNRVLTENEIMHYFDMTICGAEVTKSKPDPQIYYRVAEALGRQCSECLVVEDSTYGVTAAHKAGMVVAAVRDDRFFFDQSLADFHIDRVCDVLSVLKKVNEC